MTIPVPFMVSRRWVKAVDITTAQIGAFATVGVLGVMGVLLTSGVAGIDILETSKLERLATPTSATPSWW